MLTETWLNDEVSDSEFVPKNYVCFRKDRDRRGGGVAILFRAYLQLVRMPNIPGVEYIFCTTYINKMRYILGAIYRPPDSSVSVLENLDDYMCSYIKPNDRLILAGDFNFPSINWNTFSTQSSDLSDIKIHDF